MILQTYQLNMNFFLVEFRFFAADQLEVNEKFSLECLTCLKISKLLLV